MYRFSVFICFLFASLVIALFTLIIGDSSFEPASDRGATLVQDLTAVRIWIVVAGLALYSWKKRYQPAQCSGGGCFNCHCLDHVP